MLFYFTATGNSLYAAKQIGTACGDTNIVSIPQIVHKEGFEFTADSIGIVCPIYGHEMPPMVKDFLKKAVFHTDYFYIIETYGARNGGCAELAEKYCNECGIKPAYINILLMVDNWLPVFDMDEECQLDKKVDENMNAIIADIKARKHFIRPSLADDIATHKLFLSFPKWPDNAAHRFHITDDCNACGTCVKVCPAHCIHLENHKAVHSDSSDCQFCLACIHACPQKAIQLYCSEKNPDARYRNPYITLAEIITANNQIKE
jgi:ferredoxin